MKSHQKKIIFSLNGKILKFTKGLIYKSSYSFLFKVSFKEMRILASQNALNFIKKMKLQNIIN